MRFIPLILCLLSFAGCATTANIDTSDLSDGIKWKELRQSGLNQEASRNGWTRKPELSGRSDNFDATVDKITWWGIFGDYTFMSTPVFNSKWYEPSGKLFQQMNFSTTSWVDSAFYKVGLPLKGTLILDHPGEWKVEILYKDKVIDRKHFHIIDPEIVQKKPARVETATPPKISRAVPQATSNEKLAPIESSEDQKFREKYRKATESFRNQEYQDTNRELQAILETEPFRSEAHLGLAAVAYQKGQMTECLNELNYLIQNPEYRERALKVRKKVVAIQKGEPYEEIVWESVSSRKELSAKPILAKPVETVISPKPAFAPRKNPLTAEVRIVPQPVRQSS